MGVYKKRDKWTIQYPHAIDPETGKVVYTTQVIGHSKRLAERAFQEKMVEWERRKVLGLTTTKDCSFGELVDWYLQLPRVQQRKGYKKIVAHCKTLRKAFGHMKASEIRPSMVEVYQHRRRNELSARGRAYAPASINREFEVLKAMFNLALREDMVQRNPCWKVAKLPENNARNRILSPDELKSLLAWLPRHAGWIVAFAFYTGMRAGEIHNLTWDRVNLREGYVELRNVDTKTSKPRRVYFGEAARAVLEEAGRVRSLGHEFVFTFAGRQVKSIKRALQTACEKAGITDFRFHDLRHTYNTFMRRAGVPKEVTMAQTGHETDVMYRRYSTIDGEDQKKAVAQFEAYLEAAGELTTSILLPGAKEAN